VAVPDANVPEQPGGPYAQAVATALQEKEMPAIADAAHPGDWQLQLRADARDGMAVPTFTLVDPGGKEQGSEQAAPVPMAIWKQGRPETLQRTATDAAPRVLTLWRAWRQRAGKAARPA